MKLLAVPMIVLLAAQGSFACEPLEVPYPIPEAERTRRVTGEQCSAEYLGPWAAAYISKAEDLGSGFVLQEMHDGWGCGSREVEYVVQDCNSGRVAIFGETFELLGDAWEEQPDGSTLIKPESSTVLSAVTEAATMGNHMSVDEILSAAAAASVDFRLEAKTRSTVSINDYNFPLGCGCKLYYGN